MGLLFEGNEGAKMKLREKKKNEAMISNGLRLRKLFPVACLGKMVPPICRLMFSLCVLLAEKLQKELGK